ncbi:MAG: hypothetical protein DMG80_11840 [Acidobacteria bacterium]|nr:MAG: hypothetical protein DMG80_11840 [Acidobacteriota bacterium]
MAVARTAATVKSYRVALTPAQQAFYFVGYIIVRAFYRVSTFNQEHLPLGGFLLLPNHISLVDAIVLQLAYPHRQIRYIIDDEFYRKPFLHPMLKLIGCIPITSRRAKDALRTAAEAMRAGDIVCLFREGQLTRSGTLLRFVMPRLRWSRSGSINCGVQSSPTGAANCSGSCREFRIM